MDGLADRKRTSSVSHLHARSFAPPLRYIHASLSGRSGGESSWDLERKLPRVVNGGAKSWKRDWEEGRGTEGRIRPPVSKLRSGREEEGRPPEANEETRRFQAIPHHRQDKEHGVMSSE